MAQGNVVVQGVTMTVAAAECVREAAVDVAADLRALRSGRWSAESLLAECLDGVDADREQGWREYVEAVSGAATKRGTLRRYDDASVVRAATAEEREASIEAALTDGGAGVITVDGIRCYVEG